MRLPLALVCIALPLSAGAEEGMSMSGMLGDYPMTREASGTSWQPESSPMTGKHVMWKGWMAMLHGYINAVYADAGGKRGDSDVFSQSMLMAMGSRSAGPGTLGVRAMISLDPLLVGKRGYPLLFQTGETADGRSPLIDRQHPHDLFMELSGSYSVPLAEHRSVFVYAGLPGEPALGPPTFMHRFSGMENPEAPLLHHWLDSTHVTFGVVTLGFIDRDFKLEVSGFHGREPDEHRYDIETGALNSWSARLSWNPAPDWALQGSFGHLHSPEQLEADTNVNRTTLSISHEHRIAAGHWQTTLAWGRNEPSHHESTSGVLLESAANWKARHTVFARAESVQKNELFAEGAALADRVFRVNKISLGYVRDFDLMQGLKLGVGIEGSRHFIGRDLEAVYGDDPVAWLLFLRLKI